MANANTSVGWTNLPTQATPNTTTALLVPTSAQNYGTLPSPTLTAGSGLYVSIPPENSGSLDWDGHQFRVRIVGIVLSGTTGTFTVTPYLGTSSTAANDSSLAGIASASITGSTTVPFHFEVELLMLWDSTTQTLTGYSTAQFNGAAPVAATLTTVITASTTPVNASALTNLQFIPFFTFGTANAANTITIKEFLIERV